MSIQIFLALALVVGGGSQEPDPCEKHHALATYLAAKRQEPIPIGILIEDIPGEDSYRLAVAEVVRTHFSDKLKVSTGTSNGSGLPTLHVYITGSRSRDFRLIRVSVEAYVGHCFVIEERAQQVLGQFAFASETEIFSHYTDERVTQAVREMAYKTLSDAVGKLDKRAD